MHFVATGTSRIASALEFTLLVGAGALVAGLFGALAGFGGGVVQYFLKQNAATLGNVAEDLNRTGKVHFEVCHNTLVERGWKPEDVFPFAKIVPSGAQEVMLREQQGYAYFKP